MQREMFTSGQRTMRRSPHAFKAEVALALTLFATALLPGCAAVTNPVANGIPIRLLPDELLAESREGFEPIPLSLLRQKPPEIYRLSSGDILGVYIEGVLGNAETPPPVNLPDSAELPPAIGYPIPVRPDGTVTLPLVGALKVEGLTVEQAERVVTKAYRDGRGPESQKQSKEPKQEKPEAGPPSAEAPEAPQPPAAAPDGGQVAPPENAAEEPDANADAGQTAGFLREENQILVTLMRPRHVRVLVVREDNTQQQVSLRNESLNGLGTTQTTIGGGYRGVGQVLELPAYENDVLNTLARTGGMPGLETTQEIIIQRGYWNEKADPNGASLDPASLERVTEGADHRRVTRIPLRLRPGQPLGFGPQDILLQNGDIVTVRGRRPQFYYTGGLLPSAEHPLPNDYDLTVLEAVLKARGPILSGGVNTSYNFNGALQGAGIGNPSPNLIALLRQTPHGGQVTVRVDLDEATRDPRQNPLVQAGDVLILQETPDQGITRYFTQVFQLNLFTRFLNRADATGTANLSVP
jgi:protein involved in polysaccharide export with SLBB domain